jgi:hypothetical protein
MLRKLKRNHRKVLTKRTGFKINESGWGEVYDVVWKATVDLTIIAHNLVKSKGAFDLLAAAAVEEMETVYLLARHSDG